MAHHSNLPQILWKKVSHKLRWGRLNPAYYRARSLLHRGKKPPLGMADIAIAQKLKRDAIYVTSLAELDLPITSEFLGAVSALLPTLPASNSHQADGDPTSARNTKLHCFSVDPPELMVRHPEILLWGLEQRLLDIIEHYLGLPPAFTNMHLRKDVGNGQQVGTRIWHVDIEDHRVIRVIIYLNDVTVDDGPFEYIPKRFNWTCAPLLKRALRASGDPILDEEMRSYVPESSWVQCTGPAGTVVLADNAALYHHGKPHNSERIALIYTYTSRHPRFPELKRNNAFNDRLSPRQQACFFVRTNG